MHPDLEFLQQIAQRLEGSGPYVYLTYGEHSDLGELAGKHYSSKTFRRIPDDKLMSRMSLSTAREAVAIGTERTKERIAKSVATLLEKTNAPGP